MRAQDVDLFTLLQFRPGEGELLLQGRRMLLFSQRSPGVLSGLIADQLGADCVRALFAQSGYRCGQDDDEAVAEAGHWDAQSDGLSPALVTHMWEGLVRVETTLIDDDPSRFRRWTRGAPKRIRGSGR